MIAECRDRSLSFYIEDNATTWEDCVPSLIFEGRFHMAGEGGGQSPKDEDDGLSSLDDGLDMDLSDLDMDLGGDLDPDPEPQPAGGDPDSLDISDLALDRPEADPAGASSDDSFDLDMDLPELDNDLGTPELEDKLAENLASVSDAAPKDLSDVDLPDLEDELGMELAESVGDGLDSVQDNGESLGLPEIDALPEDLGGGDDSVDSIDMDAPDLDMGLPELEDDGSAPQPAALDDSLDLPDLDMDLPDLDSVSDDIPAEAAPQPGASEDLPDLDLNLDLGNDLEAGAPEVTPTDDEDIPGLEKALGETMDLDMEGVVEPEVEKETSDLDLDLGDLETMDDSAAAPDGGGLGDALDLGGDEEISGDLDLDLGDLGITDDEGDDEATALDFGMDDIDVSPPAAEESAGDLDLDLGGDEAPASDDMGELDLDLGGEGEVDSADLDLDLDGLEEGGAPEPLPDDSDALGMGELDMTEELVVPEEGGDEMELDLSEPGAPAEDDSTDLGDLEMDDETDMDIPHEEATEEMSIDLDSFELTMDSGEPKTEPSEATAGMDLDFDMDIDGESQSDDSGMDLDIDLDGEIASTGDMEVEVVDDDQEHDLEIDEATDDFHVDMPIGDAIQTMEFNQDVGSGTMEMAPDEADQTMELHPDNGETMELPPEEAQPEEPPPPPPAAAAAPGKGGGLLKALIAVIIILGLIGGGGFAAMKFLGVEIPFVSDFLGMSQEPASKPMKVTKPPATPKPPASAPAKPPAAITGEIILEQDTVSYQWVQNQAAGYVLVINGTVTNGYNVSASNIQVKATAYDAAGATLASAKAYCGNPIADSQVQSMAPAQLRRMMANAAGAGETNVDVASGARIDFTLVFINPPENLDEVNVEPSGANPG